MHCSVRYQLEKYLTLNSLVIEKGNLFRQGYILLYTKHYVVGGEGVAAGAKNKRGKVKEKNSLKKQGKMP